MHREPVFLSTASLVEIEAAIGRVPASQQPRICALRDWLDGLTSTFSDGIHLVDASVAVRVFGQINVAAPDRLLKQRRRDPRSIRKMNHPRKFMQV
jgi:hypothetical protein